MDSLLNLVRGAIMQHSSDPNGFDPQRLIGTVEGLFGQHQATYGSSGMGNVRPASQDPYGDPGVAGGQFGNVRPASQDPYGDPG